MIVRIGKILRIEVNGLVHYININSFSLKEVNNFVNFLQDDKLVVRVLLSDLTQSIEEISTSPLSSGLAELLQFAWLHAAR